MVLFKAMSFWYSEERGDKVAGCLQKGENLVFFIHEDMELKEAALKMFMAQVECLTEHCKQDKDRVAYNLNLLNKVYESIKEYYLLMEKSERLHHQLFLINQKLLCYSRT
jgi:hypothetical protein